MWQRQGQSILLALLACIAVPISSAATGDQKLLSLIPPGAQAVARISSRSSAIMGHYVLTSRNNGINYNDFLALTGADSTRVVHELIYVVAGDSSGMLNEHNSLLASGNFDRNRIYRSALSGGASVTRYRGLPVLVVQPFARERSEFNEVRWLAIPESSILLFGSIASVQLELDRHLDRSPADPRLVARLSRLRRDNNSWCVLSLLTWTPDIRDSLAALNPKLTELLKDGDTLQFGTHYGRQIEFEYEITTPSTEGTRRISDSPSQSLAELEKGSALLRFTDAITEGNTVRGVTKVSTARYNAWLREILARKRERNAATP
jgi:hypothetical protein